ncbi:SDR family NAD(P)-dependent oxidoreductase [Oceanicoccus sp. KOV_DT_Chl]|uniref:SDR family NAD(P)-dependent oxidoreductase n=1 Tax=Oceanicoccus sp. KOV_DT_Chl TaxID=1904639 RepID=UPI000C7B2776|nr:SDR family oxidoreductase [Oceanicoccus sp. KOV_DT_Chl]
MNIESFNNKVILITGAAGGFGTLLTEKLSRAGAKLVLGDRNTLGLELLIKNLGGEQPNIISQSCDVSKESEVAALVAAAVDNFGRLDIAINNAGMSSVMKSLTDTTEADMDLNFAINTKGVFFGMKYQIQQMLTQGEGIILNVASKAGIGGAPKLTAYSAAKHAVVGITKTAALEYARYNIRINAICPYFSPTPMVTDGVGINSDLLDMLAKGSPMKRLGEPEEMVTAMLMLIAPENSYLNGQAIAVDGGSSAF